MGIGALVINSLHCKEFFCLALSWPQKCNQYHQYEAGGKHNKPYVHVEYGDYEASVGIDGEVLAGVLPEKQYRLVAAWLTLHEDELYEAWNDAVQMKQLPKIRPLS